MSTLVEMEELAEVIDQRLAGRVGSVDVRPAVSFARIDRVPARLPVERLRGIAVLARGAKLLHAGGQSYASDCSSYLVSLTSGAAEVEVLDDGGTRPLLGMVVSLDLPRVGRLIADMGEQCPEEPPSRATLVSGTVDRQMARALLRLAHLVCSDGAWGALHEGAIRDGLLLDAPQRGGASTASPYRWWRKDRAH